MGKAFDDLSLSRVTGGAKLQQRQDEDGSKSYKPQDTGIREKPC
eukprot:s2593_g3.t1